MSLTENESVDIGEEYLEHYGILGMHWGIRKGKSKTGISRARSALIDRNKRSIHIRQLAASGKKYVG